MTTGLLEETDILCVLKFYNLRLKKILILLPCNSIMTLKDLPCKVIKERRFYEKK